MRLRLTFALWLGLAASAVIASGSEATAQIISDHGIFGGGYTGDGGYTGVGNLTIAPTIIGYWGVHCYKKSYTGNVADVYSVANSTVEATLTCSNGVIGATADNSSGWTLATVKSTCTSTSACLATTVYDQSGANFCNGAACNMLGATTAPEAPALVYGNGTSSCGASSSFLSSGNFCLYYSGDQTLRPNNGNWQTVVGQPVTYACVGMQTSNSGQADVFADGGGVSLSWQSTTTVQAYAGTSESVTSTSNAWHGMFMSADGASSLLQVDNGTANTSTQGTASLTTFDAPAMGSVAGGGSYFTGYLAECFLGMTSPLTTSNDSTILANWASYWGGGIP
jgi:hypothetical protein